MAEAAGYAVLQVIPSMRGTRRMLEAALNGPADAAGKTAGSRVGGGLSGALSDHLRSSAPRVARMLGRALGEPGEREGDNLGHTIGAAIDRSLGRAVEAAGKGALAKLVAVTAGAGVAVSGAIAPAAGAILALPAAAGVAAAGVATLATAVHGVGDALKAAAEGDAEKLAEAMAELSPNARAFVRSMQGIGESFAPVRRAVQDRLFAGLGEQMQTAADRAMPALEAGMGDVASATNGLATEAARAAGTPLFRGQLESIFAGTAAATSSFHGAVAPLLTVVAELVKIGLPLVEQFGHWASGALGGAAAFLSSEEGAAKMSATLDRAVGVLGQLGRIGGNLGAALAGIFGASAEDGQSLLDTIESLTARFATWIQSAEGQEKLGEVFGLLSSVFSDLLTILPGVASVLGTITSAFSSLSPETQSTLTQMLAWSILLGPLAGKIGGLVAGVGAAGRVIGGLSKGVAGAVGAMGRLVGGFRDARVASSAFSGIAGTIGGKLRGALSGARAGITAAAGAARTAGAAALASARSWSALALAQTRAALAAGRAKVATIATAVAQRAIRAATLAWTGVQWLLNTALTANPIGLVVVAIGALIAGVVLAYNKVGWFRAAVDAAFSAIGAVATWLWQSVLQPAWRGIAAGAVWLGGKIRGLYTSYISPALSAVGSVFKWLWSQAKVVWLGIQVAILKARIKILQAFLLVRRGVAVVRAKFTQFKARAASIWSSVQSAISTTGDKVRGVFGKLKDGVAAVRQSFETARDGIGKAWGKLQKLTRKPAKFVIESVYNQGIRKVWNWVADKVGLGTLDKVTLPKGFARGGILPGSSTWRQGDDQIVTMRRGEGVAISEAMKVPALRNELLTWNRLGVRGGTAALQRYAEGRRPPMGASRPVKDLAQGAGYAKGGIVGSVANFGKDVAAGFLTGGFDKAVDKVTKPLVDIIAAKFGRDGFKGLPTRATEKIVGKLKSKLKSFLSFFSGGGADDWVGLESASARLKRAARWVDTQIGLPYQWGGGGNPSWDCSGFMAGIENTIRGITPGRRYTTMSFRGKSAPSGWVQGLRSPFTVGVMNGGSARGSHMAGTLLGANVEAAGSKGVVKGSRARGTNSPMFTHRYGFAPVAKAAANRAGRGGDMLYDDGGWLQPGRTVVDNRTGEPEAVYTSAQQDRIERLIAAVERGHGSPLALTVNAPGRGDAVDDVADGVVRGLRKASLNGLYPRAGV